MQAHKHPLRRHICTGMGSDGSSKRLKVLLATDQTQTASSSGQMMACPEKDVPDFVNLPMEVTLMIFSWFNRRELYQIIAPVCKTWYHLSRDATLWKRLTFTKRCEPTHTVLAMLQHAPFLEYLELVEREDADEILCQVRRSNHQLRALIIKNCRGSNTRDSLAANLLISVVERCSYIEELTIKYTPFRSVKFHRILGKFLPRLRKLNVSYNFYFDRESFDLEAHHCTPLEEFHCSQISGSCSDESLIILAIRMKHTLTVLKLNGTQLTDKGMEAISSCHNLQKLHIPFAINITSVGLLELANLRNLKTMVLTMANRIQSSGWKHFFSTSEWQQLKILSLELCPRVDDLSLACLSKACPSLEVLRVCGCVSLTWAGMLKVIRECRSLQYVDVFATSLYRHGNRYLSWQNL